MNKLAVIIPSRNAANLTRCAGSVLKLEPDARVIIVDDGLDEAGEYFSKLDALKSHGVDLVFGEKPFIFSRNINIGIRAAETDDVILLNDDAILQTPGGFTLLQQAAEDHPEYGVIASTTNNVGNRNQLPHGVGLREDPRMVCFVCVLIPRRTIDLVGMMAEEFTAYGYDDDDFCLRVRQAGLKIGIHDGCFVDHASLQSTFRGNPHAPANLESGRQIFIDKWGSHPL